MLRQSVGKYFPGQNKKCRRWFLINIYVYKLHKEEALYIIIPTSRAFGPAIDKKKAHKRKAFFQDLDPARRPEGERA